MAVIIAIMVWTMLYNSFVASTMHRIAVTNASIRNAVCSDGSDAIYYLKRTHSTKWIVFIESGGGCVDYNSCQERQRSEPYLFGSVLYPKTAIGEDILSSNDKASIFVDFNKVLIPYCSSDMWLGNKTLNFGSNDGNQFRVAFRGSQIFRSVLEDLEPQGLLNGTELWLSGSSAGGIGVANNARFVHDTYRHLKIAVLTDSSWFINYRNMLTKLGLSKFFHAISEGIHPSCTDDARIGYPCCLSLFCIITNKYFPKDVRLFNIISRYDMYSLSRGIVLPREITNSDSRSKILSDMLSFGGEISHSVRQTKTFLNVNSVITSCFQHAYLSSNSLWSPGMLFYARSQTSLKLQSLVFHHSVQSGRWNNVAVNGESIKKILTKWYEAFVDGHSFNSFNGSGLERMPSSFIEDSCRFLQCNPTCPKSIDFYANVDDWPKWAHWLVLMLYLIFTLTCLAVKILWTVQRIRESRLQNQFVNSLYDGANSLNAVGLPCCIPSNYIGLSCTDVQYSVSVEPHKRQVPGDKKLRWREKLSCVAKGKEKKKILKGVNAYFNPGQLVAIMGPSGSGKTTFLDILTGRKESRESNVFINGLNNDETREWFKRHSGYVLQLATPYYEELTVRENLTCSALMRLPHTMSIRNKLMRVEQVIGQTGLNDYADVIVGKATGPGLSGGQKRRLCVAIQLLRVPSVLFLDEPTSGLDSASSLELLETLHGLTLSGRLVVLTIHQPRIEIFHMFDRILFLSHGHAAYYGSPIMAPTMIAEALKNSGEILDASNPADTIMDVLMFKTSQAIIVEHYESSGEIEAIKKAIATSTKNPVKTLSMKVKRYSSSLSDRLLSFDRRATRSQTIAQKLYLLVIFLFFGLSLGSVYWQTDNGILLMSCYQVFLCASQLFMASVIHAHFTKSMAVFTLEQAEGVGKSYELVIHAFVRISALTVIPLLLGSAIIYLCTVTELDLWKFFVTTIIHMQLNHVWIAIIMLSACSFPGYSPLICPILSAVSGFAGGFLVPEPEMPIFYYWLFYINPTHWAYGSTMKLLMNDVVFGCKSHSRLDCKDNVGSVILQQFGFGEVNPYRNMVIMIIMLFIFLAATMAAVELRYTDKLKRWRRAIIGLSKESKKRFMELYNVCNSSKHEDTERLIRKKDVESANGSCLRTTDVQLKDAKSHDPTDNTNNNVKKRKSLIAIEMESLPFMLPVKAKPMLTGRLAHETRPNTIAEYSVSESLERAKSSRVTRSNSFTCTGRPVMYESNVANNREVSEETRNIPVIPTITVGNSQHPGYPALSDDENCPPERESDLCLSNYLDSIPKHHEVYSSVFGDRPKNVRKRSVTKRLPENVKRSGSVLIQRKASMLILAERRKSMTLQIAGFGETFSYYNEVCNDKKPVPRRHVSMGAKRKIEMKRQQRVSDGSSRASVSSVDYLKIPDISVGNEQVNERRPRLLSQNAIDIPDYKEQEDADGINSLDFQLQVPCGKNISNKPKRGSLDSRQNSSSFANHDLLPRRIPGGVPEPVKVSALKISRRKLVSPTETPESHARFSDKYETDSRSSLCRTPLGSIDEVEEGNSSVESQAASTRKTAVGEAQQTNCFSKDFAEVTNWLRKHSKEISEGNKQSDSDVTTTESVVDDNQPRSADLGDIIGNNERPSMIGLSENDDTDEEVYLAFHNPLKENKKKDVPTKNDNEPITSADQANSNDIGSCFLTVEDGNEGENNIIAKDIKRTNDAVLPNSLGLSTAVLKRPKIFSNALYSISNGALGTMETKKHDKKVSSSRMNSLETRSNEELSTEQDRARQLSVKENDHSSSLSRKDAASKAGCIRRTSSCEFDFDDVENVADNDIVRIRSLRRKSKKQKMEKKTKRHAKEKATTAAN